ASRPCKVPVILNVYDAYMFGANAYDLAVDVEPAFAEICQMTWCHQSQIREWLPWVGRHKMSPPPSPEEWAVTLRKRFARKNRDLGLKEERPLEVFTVTAWGNVPDCDQLLRDFPIHAELSNLTALRQRLRQWQATS